MHFIINTNNNVVLILQSNCGSKVQVKKTLMNHPEVGTYVVK